MPSRLEGFALERSLPAELDGRSRDRGGRLRGGRKLSDVGDGSASEVT